MLIKLNKLKRLGPYEKLQKIRGAYLMNNDSGSILIVCFAGSAVLFNVKLLVHI